ncbi:YARHG domain-containing protein [Butyrivibrio sp. AE3004]|uniref:YARHG domain-containing protein n=1 Tax=Butyrivibrio sp. AE3004 TaxID=1506994 RepID=UPI0004942830|nr:YARHG domain-containing protein [Butyrivibrio sp. AE3004]
MKLIDLTCPHCGSLLRIDADRERAFCEHCGAQVIIDHEVQHIKYDGAEQAGYEFEKGRQRAQAEAQYEQPVYTVEEESPKEKPFLPFWIDVFLWIVLFPIMSSIHILKSKKYNTLLKPILILIMWIFYFAILDGIGLSGKNTKTNTNTYNNAVTEKSYISETTDEKEEYPSKSTTKAITEENTQTKSTDSAVEKNMFPTDLPYSFVFYDGTNWQTVIHLRSDGKFRGYYVENGSESNAEYPNGTCCYSFFSGKMSDPATDENKYSMKINELTYDDSFGDKESDGGVRYIYTAAKGIREGLRFELYKQDAKVDSIPGKYQSKWKNLITQVYKDYSGRTDTIGDYVIFSTDEDAMIYFCGMDNIDSQLLYPDVYSRVLTEADVLTIWEKSGGEVNGRNVYQMIINEMYARHGFKFGKQDLADYFTSKFWYWDLKSDGALTDDMSEVASLMSKIESDNVILLKNSIGNSTVDSSEDQFAEGAGAESQSVSESTTSAYGIEYPQAPFDIGRIHVDTFDVLGVEEGSQYLKLSYAITGTGPQINSYKTFYCYDIDGYQLGSFTIWFNISEDSFKIKKDTYIPKNTVRISLE